MITSNVNLWKREATASDISVSSDACNFNQKQFSRAL